MAMFGTRKKQAFGMMPPMGPYNTPGIGDGMIERQQMGAVSQGMGQLPDITNMPDMQQPEQKTGKRGPSWLGILGDSLQILGGGQASYVPQMQEQRQREQLVRQRALERQQERETGWQDWVKKEEYKRANPDPGNPHYWEMNDGSLGRVGPDGKPEVVYKDPTPKTTYITADNGDGTKTIVPIVNGVPQIGSAQPAPPAPVGKLRPIGGGVSNGTSGF